MNTLLYIVLTLTVMGIGSAHKKKCSQVRSCVFETGNGLIDLSIFKHIKYVQAHHSKFFYRFNPCNPFYCKPEYYVLMSRTTQEVERPVIGEKTKANCGHSPSLNHSLALEYMDGPVKVAVTLNCTADEKPKLIYDDATSNINKQIFNFVLSSQDACAKPPTTTTMTTTNTTATTMTTTNTTAITMTTTNTTATTMTTTNTTATTMTTTNTTATTSSTNTTMTTMTTETTRNGTTMNTTTVTTNGTSGSTKPSQTTTPQKASSIQPIGFFVVLTALIVLLHHGIQA